VAFNARLDYFTQRNQTADAERQLVIAAEDLNPDFGIVIGAALNSEPGDDLNRLSLERYDYNAGFDFNPKLNRKRFRNGYRSALIDVEAARRALSLFEDNIKLEVRNAWRTLEQARISYEIQQNSVRLSERRVFEQQLLLEIGKGTAIDRVDAENALINARNSLSRAIVSHTIANLSLWRDMGILYIKANGQWEGPDRVTTS